MGGCAFPLLGALHPVKLYCVASLRDWCLTYIVTVLALRRETPYCVLAFFSFFRVVAAAKVSDFLLGGGGFIHLVTYLPYHLFVVAVSWLSISHVQSGTLQS